MKTPAGIAWTRRVVGRCTERGGLLSSCARGEATGRRPGRWRCAVPAAVLALAAALPAHAQVCTACPDDTGTFWTASLEVGGIDTTSNRSAKGYCLDVPVNGGCGYGELSDDDFTLDATNYRVKSVRWGGARSGQRLHLTLDKDLPSNRVGDLTLVINGDFALSEAARGNDDGDANDADGLSNNYKWKLPKSWQRPVQGSTVRVRLEDAAPKGVTVAPTRVSVDEGSTTTYTVKLDHEPAENVVITPASGDTGAVAVSTAATDNTLTFTPMNWSTAQTVTVTGVKDTDFADESVTVTHGGAGSGYEPIPVASVTVAVLDYDSSAPAADAPTVDEDWALIPKDGANNALFTNEQSFRLLFVTSTGTAASNNTVGHYNSFVQQRAAANDHLAAFSSQFRALVQPWAVADHMRPNSRSQGRGGVPIYWVNGPKVADDYADFYDGSWDHNQTSPQGNPTDENGNALTSQLTKVWTGSRPDGTNHVSYQVGDANPIVGKPHTLGRELGATTASGNTDSSANSNRLYGLSPVITVVWGPGEPDPTDLAGPQDPEDPQDPPSRSPGGGGGGGAPGGDDPDDDDGDAGGTDVANRAPQAAEPIADATLRVGARLEIDLSDAFDDPDGDALAYEAQSSNGAVAAVEVDGDTLTVRGLGRGTAEITATAEDPDGASASQTFGATVTEPEAAWYLPPASDARRQGFVRVLNHSDAAGEASIVATDDAGVAYAPLTLALGPRAATHFHTGDLESGNAAKGLAGATGMGTGGWRLAIESETLDVEALAYVRTPDGFLTGMNDVAPLEDGALRIATFNPGSNVDQVSLLRLVNPGTEEAEATVTGTDDAGLSPGSPVVLTLPAGTSCTVDAAQLESGSGLACGAPQDGLGDGAGKWRLAVASHARLMAMSLLSSPGGHLTNLSGKAAPDWEDLWHVDLFPAASDPLGRQGFVRVVNPAAYGRTATILAYDDSDTRYDTLRLSLDAGETAHFNSDDLELGNRSKGLRGSTGSGTGTWRLAMYGLGEAHAYVRTADGFLAAMNAAAPRTRSVHRVAFFNPGSNRRVSVLRLVNRSRREAQVSIDGTDDLGLRPGTTVRVLVPGTDAVELTAAELESGDHDAIESGALGDGTGKWRLRVASTGLTAVLSLLSSPSGHLTNLSRADSLRGLGPLPAALLPSPETVTLERADDEHVRGRWSAVEGASYDVDLLRDGVRQEERSLTRARGTSFRWQVRPGTYSVRVRSVNAEHVAGPSRVSEKVVVD